VISLLRTYYEAREAWDGRANGAGVKLMPRLWQEGSYAELERCLSELRDSPERRFWFHATRRYRDGSIVTLVVPVQRSLRGPHYLLPSHCELEAGAVNVSERYASVRVYRWFHEVDQVLADEGVERLVGLMYDGARERIVIPDFYYRRALGLPSRDSEPVGALIGSTS
jgi:hypothetical protein